MRDGGGRDKGGVDVPRASQIADLEAGFGQDSQREELKGILAGGEEDPWAN